MGASAGLRLYGLNDFLTNPNYQFYDSVVSHIPELISEFIIYYGFIADAHMNLFTRAPSTYNMVAEWFREGCWCCKRQLPKEDAEQNIVVESRGRKTVRIIIQGC